eukprot:jgi/Psemu1/2861/gm1.2861_g
MTSYSVIPFKIDFDPESLEKMEFKHTSTTNGISETYTNRNWWDEYVAAQNSQTGPNFAITPRFLNNIKKTTNMIVHQQFLSMVTTFHNHNSTLNNKDFKRLIFESIQENIMFPELAYSLKVLQIKCFVAAQNINYRLLVGCQTMRDLGTKMNFETCTVQWFDNKTMQFHPMNYFIDKTMLHKVTLAEPHSVAESYTNQLSQQAYADGSTKYEKTDLHKLVLEQEHLSSRLQKINKSTTSANPVMPAKDTRTATKVMAKEHQYVPWDMIIIDGIGPWKIKIIASWKSFGCHKSTQPASCMAVHALNNGWPSRYPKPVNCIIDQGKNCMSNEFRLHLDNLGIKAKVCSVCNPQANVVLERVHVTIKSAM